MFATNFTNIDWSIVGFYLVLTVVVGVFANRFIHNVGNYMVGGRACGAWLNASSYIGTLTALSAVMYSAQEGFTRGFSYMMIPFLGMAAAFFVGATGFVIKKLRQLNLTTITEYFEIRYNRKVRVTASIICAFAGIINMGLFPKIGAIFIAYSTGLTETAQNPVVLVNIITSVLIVLVLFYTILGGMVSVILTDFAQYIIISLGVVVGLYFCLVHPSIGWDKMVTALQQYRGEAAFNPVHQSSYGWTFMIWQALLMGIAVVTWAPEASRMLTAKDYKTTMRTFLLGTPAWIIGWGAIPAIWGVAAFTMFAGDSQLSAYFMPDGPAGAMQHSAEAFPLLFGKILPTGFLGIFVAGMVATFMSTHDSYFLCWSSVVVRDIVNPLRRKPLSDKAQIWLTRGVILTIGIFLLVWGLWYELPASVWTYMAITGNIFFSGAGVVLIVSVYWKRASSVGAMVAIPAGLFSVSALFIGPIQRVFPWITEGLLALSNYAICIVLFVVFSLLFPDKAKSR